MYINGNVVFLANGRTASTAIAESIMDQLGFRNVGQPHHESYYNPAYEYFTLVRNHWDAIASVLCMRGWDARKDGPASTAFFMDTIDNYIPGLFNHRQAHMRSDIPAMWKWVNTPYNPTVLRWEDLPDNVVTHLQNKGFGIVDLSINYNHSYLKRDGLHHKKYFTPATANFVAQRWADEIAEMGYSY